MKHEDEKKLTVRQFVDKFLQKKFEGKDVLIQIKAGWFDWFCRDEALAGKTKKLGSMVKRIVNSKKFDPDKCYVFFKNNCPMNGPLYDSFSICNYESGDVLFWVTPRSGHSGVGEVYAAPDFTNAAFTGNTKGIVQWFMS